MSNAPHGLPPFMGFPQEEYIPGSLFIPTYTCVVGPFRIFVYHPGGLLEGELAVERKVNDPSRDAAAQFLGTEEGQPYWATTDGDPFTLMSIIHDITSEGKEDEVPTPTASATDLVSTPQDKVRASLVNDWKRQGCTMGTMFATLGPPD